MNRRVYIAASSADIERVIAWTAALREVGVGVVSTWPATVAAVGAGNPRDATRAQRQQWSETDLEEVNDAALIWFLVPSLDKQTRGAWIEVGFAHALGTEIVASGDVRQSIFLALGDEYETDREAFAAIAARLAVPA